jgi:tyrosine-protein phosphatase YwqE
MDIHSHIVWGFDNGPASAEESTALLDSARTSGTTDIVATIHSNPDYVYQADLLQEKITELPDRTGHRPEIRRNGDNLAVATSAGLMVGYTGMIHAHRG